MSNHHYPGDDDDHHHEDHDQHTGHDDHHLADPGHGTHDHPDGAPHGADHDGHFVIDSHLGGFIGHLAQAIGHWHEQQHEHAGGITSQEFVLASHDGPHHSEAELTAIASDHGWFIPGGGTPLYDAGSLLEHFGFHVEQRHDGRLEDLELALSGGMDVIVALTDVDPHPGLDLDSFAGIPGQEVSHAVQVVGVDRTDGAYPVVLLNDPGISSGSGLAVDLTDFLDSWAASDNFMVLAEGDPDD